MKKIIVFALVALSANLAKAQSPQDISKGRFIDRLYVGGNLGAQFGSVTSVEVSPLVGYRITNDFSAGLGITYIYYKFDLGNSNTFETNIYGYKLFARHNFLEKFYATTEFENLSLEYYNRTDGSISREWIPGLFIGGGYFEPIGRNAGFNIAALYNVIYDDQKSPYNSPLVLRIGFTLGF
ncbi:MAG TPA: hypothetical protein PKL31_17260 [Fulvivirga sp.]|nr:hypothetical protein [Fulvivirga sp.]